MRIDANKIKIKAIYLTLIKEYFTEMTAGVSVDANLIQSEIIQDFKKSNIYQKNDKRFEFKDSF